MEIEDRTTVTGISFDKGKKKGEYRISMQIPVPTKIAGDKGGGGPEESSKVITVNARSLAKAQRKVEKEGRTLFFGHTRIISFGEDLAEEGFKDIIDAIRRKPEIRRMAIPIIVEKGDGLDLIKYNSTFEQIPLIHLMATLEKGMDQNKLPNITLGSFLKDASHPAREPRMISFAVGEDKAQVNGMALFKDRTLLGFLHEQEMNNWMRLADQKKGDIITIQTDDKNDYFSIYPSQVDTQYDFHLKDNTPSIDVTIEINGDLDEVSNKFQNEELEELENLAEARLATQTKKMITEAQDHYKTDIFNFGEKVRAFNYRSIWEKVDWNKAFRNANISVDYDVIISGTREVVE